jgi:hypothetical protein
MSVICISSKASSAPVDHASATGSSASSTPRLRAACMPAWISCMKAWKCTRRTGRYPAPRRRGPSASTCRARPRPRDTAPWAVPARLRNSPRLTGWARRARCAGIPAAPRPARGRGSACPPLFTPVLIGGCVIILVSFAVRASFGVFQIPIAEEFGWLRAEFSLAIAIQNLAWGIGQPIFGAVAEKFRRPQGDHSGRAGLCRRACPVGLRRDAAGASDLEMAGGLRRRGHRLRGDPGRGRARASDENRSMALAIATAAGSAGQVFGAPVAEWLLTHVPGSRSS